MKKRSNSNWMQQQKHDSFYRRARSEHHRARSYYKLQEIDNRFHVLSPLGHLGIKILDLGCAPGAWIEYILFRFSQLPTDIQIMPKKIIGIDVTSVRPFDQTSFVELKRMDVFSSECFTYLQTEAPFQVILSDLAPKTTGDFRDEAIQEAMVERVLYFLQNNILASQGNLMVKIFQSIETERLVKLFQEYFTIIKRTKPQASRDRSREIYLIGLQFQRKNR